jgi:AcrR family transcriptional regulator
MARNVKPGAKRRQRGSLTREQVVLGALELADRDGIEALTMPSLAHKLGCGVMTLYGYIESKEDLLAALAQAGLRDLRLPNPSPENVEDILIAWGRSLRQTLLAHPSLATIFLSRAVMGAGIFRGIEALLGRLSKAGVSPAVGVRAIYAVLTYTTGFVAWELPRTRNQSASVYAAAWRRAYHNLPVDDFPLAAAVLEELGKVAGEEQFEIGLRALARGLAASVPNRSERHVDETDQPK